MGKVALWKTKKNCGNCIYWCGDREINHIRKCIEVDSSGKGTCSLTHGPRQWNATCPKHEMHGVCKL